MPQIRKVAGGWSSKVMLPDKKQRGLKAAREDQLAVAEFDRLSEKRDQKRQSSG